MTVLLESIQKLIEEGFKITTFITLILLWRKHESGKRMKRDIEAIKHAVGVMECAGKNDSSLNTVKRLLTSSWVEKSSAQHVDAYTAKELIIISRGNREMKEYLKKLGRTKFQAFILTTLTNLGLMIGYLMNVNDVQSDVSAYTPLFIGLSQLAAGAVYKWVEGSVDKARVRVEVSDYDAKALNAVRDSSEDA